MLEWSPQDAGYFACAQISALQRRWDDALEEADRSLIRNWHNHKARHLKTVVLRYENRSEETLQLIAESLKLDRFNFGCLYERFLLTQSESDLSAWKELMREEANNYHELALDYAAAGCWKEAVDVLNQAVSGGFATPMTHYYIGWCSVQEVCIWRKKHSRMQQLLVRIIVSRIVWKIFLHWNVQHNITHKMPKLIIIWAICGMTNVNMTSLSANGKLLLNWIISSRLHGVTLALAYFNKQQRTEEALQCMEKAFALDSSDARVLMELDQLYKRLGRPHAERLAFLRKNSQLIAQRDDLYLEQITLLNQVGEYEEARKLLDARIFHPWEGVKEKCLPNIR